MKTSKAEEPTGAAVSPRDRAVQEKLEILKKDYRDLDTRKIQTETHIKNLEEELQRLREQAQNNYGTSDLEELTRLLEARRRENERLVADYEEHIQGIKDRLADIDRQPGKEQDES
jgi:bacterioferritin (cytochrome b1)